MERVKSQIKKHVFKKKYNAKQDATTLYLHQYFSPSILPLIAVKYFKLQKTADLQNFCSNVKLYDNTRLLKENFLLHHIDTKFTYPNRQSQQNYRSSFENNLREGKMKVKTNRKGNINTQLDLCIQAFSVYQYRFQEVWRLLTIANSQKFENLRNFQKVIDQFFLKITKLSSVIQLKEQKARKISVEGRNNIVGELNNSHQKSRSKNIRSKQIKTQPNVHQKYFNSREQSKKIKQNMDNIKNIYSFISQFINKKTNPPPKDQSKQQNASSPAKKTDNIIESSRDNSNIIYQRNNKKMGSKFTMISQCSRNIITNQQVSNNNISINLHLSQKQKRRVSLEQNNCFFMNNLKANGETNGQKIKKVAKNNNKINFNFSENNIFEGNQQGEDNWGVIQSKSKRTKSIKKTVLMDENGNQIFSDSEIKDKKVHSKSIKAKNFSQKQISVHFPKSEINVWDESDTIFKSLKQLLSERRTKIESQFQIQLQKKMTSKWKYKKKQQVAQQSEETDDIDLKPRKIKNQYRNTKKTYRKYRANKKSTRLTANSDRNKRESVKLQMGDQQLSKKQSYFSKKNKKNTNTMPAQPKIPHQVKVLQKSKISHKQFSTTTLKSLLVRSNEDDIQNNKKTKKRNKMGDNYYLQLPFKEKYTVNLHQVKDLDKNYVRFHCLTDKNAEENDSQDYDAYNSNFVWGNYRRLAPSAIRIRQVELKQDENRSIANTQAAINKIVFKEENRKIELSKNIISANNALKQYKIDNLVTFSQPGKENYKNLHQLCSYK